MQRFVLEPVLFAIFGELLFPNEPVEYLIPYSTVLELYELLESEQIVTDPGQNVLVKQNLEQLIEFFERPFVRKKIEKTLRMPWSKSTPILFSDNVQFTVVFSIDNAEFGERFDPIETELLLLARREKLPIISDQLPFQQRIVESGVGITVIDVAEFGFFVEDYGPLDMEFADEESFGSLTNAATEPLQPFELHEGAGAVTETVALQPEQPKKKEMPLFPLIIGGFLLILIASLFELFR
ncbi:MAG: ADP-heptose synthase [Tumebacillaceae bacterium]